MSDVLEKTGQLLAQLRTENARLTDLLLLLYQEMSEGKDAELVCDWGVRKIREALKETPW
jgi:hypothetical protein